MRRWENWPEREVLLPNLGKEDSSIVIQAFRKTDYRVPNLISKTNSILYKLF
jgi:hypothetical protein